MVSRAIREFVCGKRWAAASLLENLPASTEEASFDRRQVSSHIGTVLRFHNFTRLEDLDLQSQPLIGSRYISSFFRL